jgi:hypothetical protein
MSPLGRRPARIAVHAASTAAQRQPQHTASDHAHTYGARVSGDTGRPSIPGTPDAGVADTMEAIFASLVYLLLRQVLQMLTQLARDGGAEDVEIGRGDVGRSKRR